MESMGKRPNRQQMNHQKEELNNNGGILDKKT